MLREGSQFDPEYKYTFFLFVFLLVGFLNEIHLNFPEMSRSDLNYSAIILAPIHLVSQSSLNRCHTDVSCSLILTGSAIQLRERQNLTTCRKTPLQVGEWTQVQANLQRCKKQ